MYYYIYKSFLILSLTEMNNEGFIPTDETFAKNYNGKIFILTALDPKVSRRAFMVSSEAMLFIKEEDISLLNSCKKSTVKSPYWLKDAISEDRVICLNMNYPKYLDVIDYTSPTSWNINIVGLGDVGATLLTGLRLLGSDKITTLGIYDLDTNKVERLNCELSQILSLSGKEDRVTIKSLKKEELFNCDIFVFCVSVGIPPIGGENMDVRLAQFHGNSIILNHYSILARKANFKGIFAIVSDPVDLLCKSLFEDSNKDSQGNWDFLGLAPEQIRGYGLGVMHARAVYYSKNREDTKNYINEGRAFGPHGEGLLIANNITNFNKELSTYLTDKAKSANLEVRKTGFKPYIAPALSSGTLSILNTINGEYHYSSNFIGGTYMGCKNKFINGCTKNETLPLSKDLLNELQHTINLLENFFKY